MAQRTLEVYREVAGVAARGQRSSAQNRVRFS
jgi:hypothetical protein